jgi:hypothetical protein
VVPTILASQQFFVMRIGLTTIRLLMQMAVALCGVAVSVVH